MGETTEQLRRDIEVTREHIGQDVDALAHQASPARVVRERVQRARSGVAGLRDRVMGTASDVGGRAGDRVSSAAGSVQDKATSAASQVSGVADDVVAGARTGAEGNPMAAGLLAFGAGWLVASLLPPSRVEIQAAQRVTGTAREHAGPVVEQAKQAAGDVGQAMKQPVQQAADEVRSTATQGAQQVRDKGAASAEEVRQQAAGQAPQ